MDVIFKLRHPRCGDSQGQAKFLAPSADNQARNHHLECSNHHPTLSTLRSKGLSHSKMKCCAIHKNLPVDVIVRLPHRRNGEGQKQETFPGPFADKQIHNCGIECSNHHPLLSTLRPNGLSFSKMKWWLTYTNTPVDVIVRLPHPRSVDSQNQETFLAPSADKQTHTYDIECSNHHPFLSILRPKVLSHGKMKRWAIHRNLPMEVTVRLPHRRSGEIQGQKTFLAPSTDK